MFYDMKLKERINPEVERKLQDAIFVGRLATEDDLAGTLIMEPVYYKDELNEYVQFHVKCLSPIPDEVKDCFYYSNNLITGSTVSNFNQVKFNHWINYSNLLPSERKDAIFNFLKDKTIIFRLTVKQMVIYAELLGVEDVYPYEKGYLIIPGPHLNINENEQDLEEKLAKTYRPFSLKHYPNIFESPEYIYYKGVLYKVSLNKSPNITTYTQNDSYEVYYNDNINHILIDFVDIRYEEHLYFIRKDKIIDLRNIFEQSKKSLEDKFENEIEEIIEIKGDEFDRTEYPIKQKYNKHEIDFIEKLQLNARKRGLFFKKEDLYAFHTSVKINTLSILGGMSGTGKTQLAKLYGETMGLELGNDLLMIPVSPSYHEPNDVLGYLNPTTGVFHESETGLVNLLLKAEQTPDKMFMVIFDEMNLSQVEHWFSPFISLLEIEKNERYLPLFSDNSYCVNNKYKSKIKIGDNIIFVGTVNFDETTKDFSDRLLDRTNVITPNKLSFKESLEIAKNNNVEDYEFESLNVITEVFRNQWTILHDDTEFITVLTDDEINLLDDIHHLMNKDDKQRGVSFRVLKGIARFLANIPVNEDSQMILDRAYAFDLQISQRVLTKIKGLESYVEPLVGRYENDKYIPGEIAELLTSEKAKSVSNFTISLDYLKNKAKELMLYGYAK